MRHEVRRAITVLLGCLPLAGAAPPRAEPVVYVIGFEIDALRDAGDRPTLYRWLLDLARVHAAGDIFRPLPGSKTPEARCEELIAQQIARRCDHLVFRYRALDDRRAQVTLVFREWDREFEMFSAPDEQPSDIMCGISERSLAWTSCRDEAQRRLGPAFVNHRSRRHR